MPREPSQVDGSEMEGRASRVSRAGNRQWLYSKLSLIWLAKRFPDARGKYARKKGACSAQKYIANLLAEIPMSGTTPNVFLRVLLPKNKGHMRGQSSPQRAYLAL